MYLCAIQLFTHLPYANGTGSDLICPVSVGNQSKYLTLMYFFNSRFARELHTLKKMADYSSRDTDNLNNFLQNVGPEFSIYTYSMLNAGVDRDYLK